MDVGEVKEAAGLYGAALSTDPARPTLHYNMGNAMVALGQVLSLSIYIYIL